MARAKTLPQCFLAGLKYLMCIRRPAKKHCGSVYSLALGNTADTAARRTGGGWL